MCHSSLLLTNSGLDIWRPSLHRVLTLTMAMTHGATLYRYSLEIHAARIYKALGVLARL